MSTDIMKLDLFDGGSFKHWQKKPWLNPTYIKIIPVVGNFGKLSRNASSRKTQQKTMDYGLEYSGDPSVLEGYTDPISVHCDSQSTLSRAYNQVYNELSRSFTEGLPRKLIESTSYENNLDKVHLSKCGSEAASYELKGLALKHSEKPRYRPKANFNGSAQSGLNEREEGYA
ncbi:hypothetical protein Tco_0610515 [Tanacetum coccineum]